MLNVAVEDRSSKASFLGKIEFGKKKKERQLKKTAVKDVNCHCYGQTAHWLTDDP